MSSEWQPIETAPRDTDVLLALWAYGIPGGERYYQVAQSTDGEHWTTECAPIWKPTHWMPLPLPPVQEPSHVE
jgi:hypothetical protein